MNTKSSRATVARSVLAVALGLVVAGCVAVQPVTDRNSTLTQGNVQMNLFVGQTTKADVLETFGAPNVTTRKGDETEVWTYQRSARVAQSTSQSGLWTIILTGSRGGGGGGLGTSSTGLETSSRMITLIIDFVADDVVSIFRSRESNF